MGYQIKAEEGEGFQIGSRGTGRRPWRGRGIKSESGKGWGIRSGERQGVRMGYGRRLFGGVGGGVGRIRNGVGGVIVIKIRLREF